MSSYWQGKGAGKRIAIRFDKPLLGDVSGRLPPIISGERLAAPGPGLAYSASDFYSATYSPEQAFDGSTSTYWQTRAALPQWLMIDFGERPEAITRFRYYSGASYRINEYGLEASNDLENWDELWSGSSAASTGWRDESFENETAYRYYRFVITSLRTSGRIYFYEAELYAGAGNETAFTVKGLVRNPLKYGPLTERTFDVESVERYPETTDTILLTMTPDSRFNDVEGNITISYEREKGTLTGNRPVEDFTRSFTPTGLEPTPISEQGTITAGIELAVDLIEVDYIDLGHKHIITAGMTVDVALIPVSEIPP